MENIKLLIRFCTLWFGVTLAFIVLAFYHKQLFVAPDGGRLEIGE